MVKLRGSTTIGDKRKAECLQGTVFQNINSLPNINSLEAQHVDCHYVTPLRNIINVTEVNANFNSISNATPFSNLTFCGNLNGSGSANFNVENTSVENTRVTSFNKMPPPPITAQSNGNVSRMKKKSHNINRIYKRDMCELERECIDQCTSIFKQ
ncbi:PREDICTED: uncharacterized protein LOC109175371 [Ipomoea nil]|uniref:uncharacterized protein LOC109175371 n=1 Tax=Ipomoea nil TaxID=35883 RepID=UPI0009010EDF|nr:PREDICTED: uncharacterized protein LOC109175371 [Ipomoea nil]